MNARVICHLALVTTLALTSGCDDDDPPAPAPDTRPASAADALVDSGVAADAPATDDGDPADAADAADADAADAWATDAQPDGAPCRHDSECVEGTFCNVGYVFGQAYCVPLVRDGGYASVASHCVSGTSARRICVNRATCAPAGSACLDTAHCCTPGNVCLGNNCLVPAVDGESCYDDLQCRAGKCSFGHCGLTGTCSVAGASCRYDLECCAGSFCDNSRPAKTDRCTAFLPAGAPCARAHECTSKMCSQPTVGVCE